MKGLRIRQYVRLGKLAKINIGKRGASLSIGKPGATINLKDGKTNLTTSLPGTGISYTMPLGKRRIEPSFDAATAAESAPPPPPPKRPSFLRRYVIRPIIWLTLLGFTVTFLASLLSD